MICSQWASPAALVWSLTNSRALCYLHLTVLADGPVELMCCWVCTRTKRSTILIPCLRVCMQRRNPGYHNSLINDGAVLSRPSHPASSIKYCTVLNCRAELKLNGSTRRVRAFLRGPDDYELHMKCLCQLRVRIASVHSSSFCPFLISPARLSLTSFDPCHR